MIVINTRGNCVDEERHSEPVTMTNRQNNIGTGSCSVVDRLVYRTVHNFAVSVYTDREWDETDNEDEENDDDNQSVDPAVFALHAATWTILIILLATYPAWFNLSVVSPKL
jgi:hypothetical protein